MSDLPESLFANPVWHALHSGHRHLGTVTDLACRYDSEVVPFAAVLAPTHAAMGQLRSLLVAGESTWVIGEEHLPVPGLLREDTLDCLQMVMPEEVSLPDASAQVVRLAEANAGEMVGLTTLAFPGFFRQRTCEMGAYLGVRSATGELIAMGGERLRFAGFSEISGVCAHPSFRGRGLATDIIWALVRSHRANGVVSWLHVATGNHRAIKLYQHMGFTTIRTVTLHRIIRRD